MERLGQTMPWSIKSMIFCKGRKSIMLKVSRQLPHWLPFFKLDSDLLLLKCRRLELKLLIR